MKKYFDPSVKTADVIDFIQEQIGYYVEGPSTPKNKILGQIEAYKNDIPVSTLENWMKMLDTKYIKGVRKHLRERLQYATPEQAIEVAKFLKEESKKVENLLYEDVGTSIIGNSIKLMVLPKGRRKPYYVDVFYNTWSQVEQPRAMKKKNE